jgi:murein DD-endopeptidase MepM/ murein hydrolase activator NlpD
MNRISILAIGLTCVVNLVVPDYLYAQKLSAVPIDLEIPFAPSPVKANGKTQFIYELHLTNFRAKNLELTRVEVVNDANKLLASYKDTELISLLGRPGAVADLPDKRVIGGGMRAVIYLQLIFDSDAELPTAFYHRLFFKSADTSEDDSVEGGRVIVVRKPPLVVGAPLRGENWLALNGLSNSSGHRRTIVVVNGKARIAQRFATDWTRIGADGLAFRGDPSKNTNWSAYGAEVLAVANARVIDIKDGIPENDPTADKKAVPITLETVGGNYITLDLGNGYFAFYAHLQPKSMRVKVGDKVTRGQILALLGNSGNSDAPHLHFHITDGSSPLGAEGVPYVFDSFDMLGVLPSKKLLISGGWKPQPNSTIDKRTFELPIEDAVVRFPSMRHPTNRRTRARQRRMKDEGERNESTRRRINSPVSHHD